MKLDRIEFRGLTCFPDITKLDLTALPAGVIAVGGPNGGGKTTLLETVPLALYRTLPTRPGMFDSMYGTDAYVLLGFSDGDDQITVRLDVNASSRKAVPTLLVNGESRAKSTREFADLVPGLFGTLDTFLASVFNAQNRAGNFLLMPKAKRKQFFTDMLGLAELPPLAEAARAAHRSIMAQVERQAGERCDLEHAQGELDAARAEAVDASKALEQVDGDLATVVPLKQAATDKRAAHLDTARTYSAAHAEAAAASGAASDAAVVGANGLRRAKAMLASSQAVVDQGTTRDQFLANREEERAGLAGKRDALAVLLEDARRQRCELPGMPAQGDIDALFEAERLVDRLKLTPDGSLLDRVPCTVDGGWYPAAGDREPVPTDLAASCPLLEAAHSDREGHKLLLADLERHGDVLDRADAIHAAELANRERKPLEVQIKALADSLDTATAAVDRHVAETADRLEEGQAQQDRQEVARNAARAAVVEAETEAARTHGAGLEAKRVATAARQAMVDHQVENDLEALTLEMDAMGEQVDALRLSKQTHASTLERSGGVVSTLAPRVAALEERLAGAAAAVQRAGDLNLLARALGADGIAALEVDVAGPRVAEVVNELLTACYGDRFSVSFETTRQSVDGKRTLEVFDVQVTDNGEVRMVEALSGGERTILSEAINLALAIVNAETSGVRWRTLWRDETAGALDSTNAVAYVEMLRKARVIGGFEQILFVAHHPDLPEMADAKVIAAGGEVIA